MTSITVGSLPEYVHTAYFTLKFIWYWYYIQISRFGTCMSDLKCIVKISHYIEVFYY